MSRDDFRAPRRRGFDDDDFTPRDKGARRSSSGYGPPAGTGGGPSSSTGSSGGGFQREAPAGGPPTDAVVKWFNAEKGFGFVELENGRGDAFLHIGVLHSTGRESVPPGAKMKVTVGQGQKGPQVVSVIEVDESTASKTESRPSGPRAPRPARAVVDLSTATEASGTVKWFSQDKGYGFVATGDGAKDVFIHISILEKAGITGVNESQKVSMRVVETAKGREAVSISLAE